MLTLWLRCNTSLPTFSHICEGWRDFDFACCGGKGVGKSTGFETDRLIPKRSHKGFRLDAMAIRLEAIAVSKKKEEFLF